MKILVLLAILISSLTSGKTAPSEAYLAGEWGCTGNRFVFMAGEGLTHDKKNIAPLGKLLDSTKGLTLAMEFEKN